MSQKIASNDSERHGGVASAECGIVMLDGPAGVAVAMTPEAAETTARSLLAAAKEAASQRGGDSHSS